jgi:hypothetical protein
LARAPVSKTGGWGFESLHSCQRMAKYLILFRWHRCQKISGGNLAFLLNLSDGNRDIWPVSPSAASIFQTACDPSAAPPTEPPDRFIGSH